MKNLETLLNRLIEKEYKPKWLDIVKAIVNEYDIRFIGNSWIVLWACSINDLCSIDSWLRQFVCKQNLWNWNKNWSTSTIEHKYKLLEFETWDCVNRNSYKYRLMLSSIQEDKLHFLLSNIKI